MSFDTRLIQILSAMAALAIMVGLAAIGVNRYLVHTHKTLVDSSLPALELASGINASVQVVGSLEAALVQADTGDDIEEISSALKQTVARIEQATRQIEDMSATAAQAPQTLPASDIVARLTANALRRVQLEARIAQHAQQLEQEAARLDSIFDAETELARLRITAGIADLYAAPAVEPLAALDALADRYFFAFERLSEVARMLDANRLQLQQVPALASEAAVADTRTEIATRLDVIARRLAYMPSPSAAAEVVSLLDRQRAALAEAGGMMVLQSEKIALQTLITRDHQVLRATIADLSDRAQQARDAVQAAGLAQLGQADRRSALMLYALLTLVAGAVLAAAVLWLYARRQLVARLAKISRRIVAVARDDYGAPITISGQDEIGRMEKALNILRRRMQDAAQLRDSLEEAVITRTGDVVAEMQASDAARAQAEAANRSKTEFLARMSHEIRTPLNGIIGMLDLLVADTQDPDRKARIRTALQSARALHEITNDILAFASSEDRVDRSNPVHFLLRELVGQMGHHLQSLAAQKGLNAVIDLSETAPHAVLGDVVKIRQIVGNLISNAVKYTDRGTVTLSVDHAIDPKTGQLVLSFVIADTGVGMTRDAIEHAFDAYTRAEAAKRAGIEGLGLGLAISRSLTEALGGALSVESQPGLGSRFTLTVPLLPGDAALAAPVEEPVPQADVARSVLVIDDHAVNRIVARGYLERLGCYVSDAETGAAGLRVAEEQPFDLILLDLDLPDMQGQEVAAQIAKGSDPPEIVALTAHLIDDTPENRVRLGVSRILSKPISPRILAEVLGAREAVVKPQLDDPVLDTLRADVVDLGAEITTQIVTEFLADLPRGIEALQTADPDARAKIAHKLKGAASNFRLDGLCAALRDLEQAVAEAADLKEVQKLAAASSARLEAAATLAGLQIVAGSTK